VSAKCVLGVQAEMCKLADVKNQRQRKSIRLADYDYTQGWSILRNNLHARARANVW